MKKNHIFVLALSSLIGMQTISAADMPAPKVTIQEEKSSDAACVHTETYEFPNGTTHKFCAWEEPSGHIGSVHTTYYPSGNVKVWYPGMCTKK